MLSIVIPIFNQHELTAECIVAVRETTQDYELILVDNGSDPPYPKPYMGFVDVTLIRNDKNLGFPVAVNQGARAAKGDVIVLLNNDVIVTQKWADRLQAHLKRFSIVGPMTNYSAGHQKTTVPAYEDKETLSKVAEEYSEQRDGLATDVNWIIGFCFMFKRAVFDEIGVFDESMWPCSGEEIDFCYRAKAAGHAVGIAHDVYVHHEGSQTLNDMQTAGDIDLNNVRKVAEEHVMEKWGKNFWNEQIVRGVMPAGGLRLNLGCGRFHLEGFVNVDMQKEVNPDLVCDILDLPYGPESVDEIYAGHILEHFDWKDGEDALRYWKALLKPCGKISVCVPDCDVLFEEYIRNPTPEGLRELNDLYIYSYCQVSPHRYAYSSRLLHEAMEGAGFVELKRMPVNHHYYPLPVHWQAGWEGVKPS